MRDPGLRAAEAPGRLPLLVLAAVAVRGLAESLTAPAGWRLLAVRALAGRRPPLLLRHVAKPNRQGCPAGRAAAAGAEPGSGPPLPVARVRPRDTPLWEA